MKSYDRQTREVEINTLRKLLNQVKESNNSGQSLLEQYDTRDSNSVFAPLKKYRDKTLAHNEKKQTIDWGQIDKALLVTIETWSFVENFSESRIMLPFHKFESISYGLDRLLCADDLLLTRQAWDRFMSRVQKAYQLGKCL